MPCSSSPLRLRESRFGGDRTASLLLVCRRSASKLRGQAFNGSTELTIVGQRPTERNHTVQRKIVVRKTGLHRAIKKLAEIGASQAITLVHAINNDLKPVFAESQLVQQCY